MGDGANRTGVWLSSFTDAYYRFIDAGFQVTVASPSGGRCPVDPLSDQDDHITDSVTSFRDDFIADMEFGNTWRLEEAIAETYDAVYIADGHGCLWDLATNEQVGKLLYSCLLDNIPVAMVGHGVAALASLSRFRHGALAGKILTCYTGTEEALLKRHRHVPFGLVDKLKGLGAQVTHGIIPFNPHIETDGNLITGQNPASSSMVAQALIGMTESVQMC